MDKGEDQLQEVKSLIGQQDLITKTITYSTVLGRGAFAAVFRAKCDELPCAAKILHTIFLDDPAVEALRERFYQECDYLKNIKHPNIVQYLGLCQEPATKQTVLLMELMDISLTNFLKLSSVPLSRGVQSRLCHDIALALAHLHSISIIHRDLSSNNVLLIGPGSRAKVSDFGMSRVVDTSKSKYVTPLSMAPGTMVYMAQEALCDNPNYTEKLDCFSFGVLTIQIITRRFPDPSPPSRKKNVASTLSPTGFVTVPVLETECRKNHIDLIDKTNPLLKIAIECLGLQMEDRPSAHELCGRIEEVTDTNDTIEDPIPRQSSDNVELQESKKTLEKEVVGLKQQLAELRSQNSQLVRAKEDVEGKLTKALQQAPVVYSPSLSSPGLSLGAWRTGVAAPDIVAKSSSTVFNDSMCCCFNHLVYDYDIKSDKWRELPKLSADDHFGLLIIFHEEMRKLVAVKNTTMCIVHDGEWVAQGRLEFLPWGILYHEKYVLLFGSEGQVLVIQFSNDTMYVRSSIRISPAFAHASVTICNGVVYLIGANNKQVWSNQVLMLPLDSFLPSSTIPKSSWFKPSLFKKATYSWLEVAPLPIPRSTCVSFNNHLLAVGGFANNQASGDVFLYDGEHNKWEMIGRVPTPRYNCLAEVVGNQLVVVGGWLNHMVKCDVVEIVKLNY